MTATMAFATPVSGQVPQTAPEFELLMAAPESRTGHAQALIARK
jgi:hypothetical protein